MTHYLVKPAIVQIQQGVECSSFFGANQTTDYGNHIMCPVCKCVHMGSYLFFSLCWVPGKDKFILLEYNYLNEPNQDTCHFRLLKATRTDLRSTCNHL